MKKSVQAYNPTLTLMTPTIKQISITFLSPIIMSEMLFEE